MLPAGSRLHTSEEFAAVVRLGRRSASPRMVVHLLTGGPGVQSDQARSDQAPSDQAPSDQAPSDQAPRAGFVVSGKVGNAVVRHRVTRRLRALMRPQLAGLPAGTDVVVRALPAAASATSAELGTDLRAALAGALRKSRTARAQSRAVGAGR
jgi:ribonuclease P protein component